MSEIAQFAALAALIIGGFGLFAFMFRRLEVRLDGRIDRLDDRIIKIDTDIKDLRRDMAEEFRAQRAEVAAQVSAVATAINARRSPAVIAYWMYETSGRLRPAVEAYLRGESMTQEHIAVLRAYLRQWIGDPGWQGPLIAGLRSSIDDLTSRDTLERWLAVALEAGIDPL